MQRYVIYCEATGELLSARLYTAQSQAQAVADGIDDCYVLPLNVPGNEDLDDST